MTNKIMILPSLRCMGSGSVGALIGDATVLCARYWH